MWVVLILLTLWATYRILDWALFDLIEICDGELAVRQCESEILLPEKLLPGRYRIFRWQRHEWSILDTTPRYAVIVVGNAAPDLIESSTSTTIMCHYKLTSPSHTTMIQREPGHNKLYPLFQESLLSKAERILQPIGKFEDINQQIQKKARRMGLDIQEIRIINPSLSGPKVEHVGVKTNIVYTTRPALVRG
ncbi:MAG: hypothetical protein K2X01_12030 [Cyanobacteria bacterium]|nr:hypothetical protein [Cyanobacteriota bacterium]